MGFAFADGPADGLLALPLRMGRISDRPADETSAFPGQAWAEPPRLGRSLALPLYLIISRLQL